MSPALSRSARSKRATSSLEHGISAYRSRESFAPQHSHFRKTATSSVERKRSTSPLSAYHRESQHSHSWEVSRRSRSISRSPCASSGGTCHSAGKDLSLEINHSMLFTNFHIYQMSWAYQTTRMKNCWLLLITKHQPICWELENLEKYFWVVRGIPIVATKCFHQASVDMAIFFMIEVLMQYPYYTMYVITLLGVVMS